MDVFFELQEGSPFYIQIGFHDTVLEIKEKFEKHQRISVCRHTLVFNDEALDDEHDVEGCNIHDRSCIRLAVALEPPPSSKIESRIGTPPSKMRLPIEVKLNDPVKRLREVVWSLEDVPLERVKLYAHGTELEDDHQICDYQLEDNPGVDVRIKPLKFTVMVLPWKANLKVAVEVEQRDKIKVLRKELEKLQPILKFNLSYITRVRWMKIRRSNGMASRWAILLRFSRGRFHDETWFSHPISSFTRRSMA